MSAHISNVRPEFDQVIVDIVDYVLNYEVTSALAYETARYCLLDTLGCGLQALDFPACTKLLGPLVPGLTMTNGARVPGTSYELDPVAAAFNIGTIIRWLDYNDTWLAAEWGHPSDNLGGILAVADWMTRNGHKLTMRDVLTAMIKAHEIQGCIALENSFNKVGLDHVVLVKVASTAVVSQMLGLTRDQTLNAVIAGVGGWTGAADVSPRAEYGLAQKLGGGRCDVARGATGADCADRRDGLSERAEREDVGLL